MSHGKESFAPLAPRSTLYQGPFGRLFPDLPPWSPTRPTDPANSSPLSNDEADEIFAGVSGQMAESPGATSLEVATDAALSTQLDQEFDSVTPAGYTYFGQFVDHDITFDPASSLQRANDPNGLLNFRTPRLDLDNVYGRGPSEQPYLYDGDDRGTFLTAPLAADGALRDLPRNGQGRALVGDMRNDENCMVSQLQLAFLLAHNTLLDRARGTTSDPDQAFERARRSLRWLYQWVVWHDFLGRVLDPAVHAAALAADPDCNGRLRWKPGYKDVYAWKNQPYMPIEFSVAAYRFGHSMVRNSYQTNLHRGFGQHVPIFTRAGADPDDLRGFRPVHQRNGIQWDWFLDMESSLDGVFPQRARRIDTRLANSLGSLHEHDDADSLLNMLAYRNLKRGLQFGLPSGTDVARALGVEAVGLDDDEPDSLWFAVLKEAQVQGEGQRLGTMGSILVAATFSGLLLGDPQSWLNQHPAWTPDDDPLLRPEDNRDASEADGRPDWTLASIIRLAGVPVDGEVFTSLG